MPPLCHTGVLGHCEDDLVSGCFDIDPSVVSIDNSPAQATDHQEEKGFLSASCQPAKRTGALKDDSISEHLTPS